jgi:DNA invertase Pin-like site-specific DNA recombinase
MTDDNRERADMETSTRTAGAPVAAIYARKSTEPGGVADADKSVTRQIEHARAYAFTKGWTVAEDHVYVDDGISGAEFVKRPGFIRLMNVLESRAPFQVLIMPEESRLGREAIETAWALKRIIDAGVQVFCYLNKSERTLDTATAKVMFSLATFAAEMERERASQRTYDAMARKARAGHVTGGVVFGYRNVDVSSTDGKRLHVVRRVDEREAKVVRRIFELYAQGEGLKRIADRLNRDRGPVPLPRRAGAPRAWATSTLRAVLRRELYRGVEVWGRTQNIVHKGMASSRHRTPEDWLTREAPELRIVSDALWHAVQTRLGEVARLFPRAATKGRLVGRPHAQESRYS